jgi:hypothetical protein
VPQCDLLATLRRREVDAAGARLSAETGLMPTTGGEMVAGTYRQRLTLTSGKKPGFKSVGSVHSSEQLTLNQQSKIRPRFLPLLR